MAQASREIDADARSKQLPGKMSVAFGVLTLASVLWICSSRSRRHSTRPSGYASWAPAHSRSAWAEPSGRASLHIGSVIVVERFWAWDLLPCRWQPSSSWRTSTNESARRTASLPGPSSLRSVLSWGLIQ